jgi:prostaglandin-endoperoxide synthase 2
VNKWLINLVIYKVPTRPYAFSCLSRYTSWDSLTDRTYTGRHLPYAPDQDANRPTPEEAASLFARDGETVLCPKSTVLFAYFAQWFTDGFLRSDRRTPVDPRRNLSNHNIDLSQLYGINTDVTRLLRSHHGGRLQSQVINGEEYPPYLCEKGERKPEFKDLPVAHFDARTPAERDEFFAMGSDRSNSQIGYVMMNVLFLREHNRIAAILAEQHPEWHDEQLFQTTRNILIALLSKVVVEEYINHIDPAYFCFTLDPGAFPNERWYRENWMAAEFNLLYRWHSLIPSRLVLDGEETEVGRTMFTTALVTEHGLGAVLEDSSLQPAGRIGLFNTDRELLETEVASIRLCRELELASYNDYREHCQFPRVTDFDQISSDPRVRDGLRTLYKGNVDRIDYYVGLLAEDSRPNAVVPGLIGRLVAIDAFSQALTNPLLAPNVFNANTFTPWGMELIQEPQTLSGILHRNLPEGSRQFYVSMTRRDWQRV